jgi:hypothetical protein
MEANTDFVPEKEDHQEKLTKEVEPAKENDPAINEQNGEDVSSSKALL